MLHNTDLNGYSTDIDPNDPMSALNTGSAVSITSVKSIRLFFYVVYCISIFLNHVLLLFQ